MAPSLLAVLRAQGTWGSMAPRSRVHALGQVQGPHLVAEPTGKLMNDERSLNAAAGGSWRDMARDRMEWEARVVRWVEMRDLPWASYEQLALEG